MTGLSGVVNETDHRARQPMFPDGTRVDVRGRFDGSWSRGFEVVSRGREHSVVRRASDGWVLPVAFADRDIRRAD